MAAVKTNGKMWSVKEQIVRDLVTGLTLQFDVCPDGSPRLRIYGDFDFGNRQIEFDQHGVECGSGTFVAGCPTPGWISGEVVQ